MCILPFPSFGSAFRSLGEFSWGHSGINKMAVFWPEIDPSGRGRPLGPILTWGIDSGPPNTRVRLNNPQNDFSIKNFEKNVFFRNQKMTIFQPIFRPPQYVGCCGQKFLNAFFRSKFFSVIVHHVKNILQSCRESIRLILIDVGVRKLFRTKNRKIPHLSSVSNFASLYNNHMNILKTDLESPELNSEDKPRRGCLSYNSSYRYVYFSCLSQVSKESAWSDFGSLRNF